MPYIDIRILDPPEFSHHLPKFKIRHLEAFGQFSIIIRGAPVGSKSEARKNAWFDLGGDDHQFLPRGITHQNHHYQRSKQNVSCILTGM